MIATLHDQKSSAAPLGCNLSGPICQPTDMTPGMLNRVLRSLRAAGAGRRGEDLGFSSATARRNNLRAMLDRTMIEPFQCIRHHKGQ